MAGVGHTFPPALCTSPLGLTDCLLHRETGSRQPGTPNKHTSDPQTSHIHQLPVFLQSCASRTAELT